MSKNEFVNRDDYLGLIHHEPNPKEWLFFESKYDTQKYDPMLSSESGLKVKATNQLGEIKPSHERQVYDMKTMLNDFGGFNDGLLLLPAVLMAFYAKRMFYADAYTTICG